MSGSDVERQFVKMLSEVEQQIDSMNEDHPNVRVKTLFFKAMTKLLNAERGVAAAYSPVNLAVACASIKVSIPRAVSEETIQTAVRIMAKGAARGIVLYARQIALVGELDLIAVLDGIITASLKDVNVKLEF